MEHPVSGPNREKNARRCIMDDQMKVWEGTVLTIPNRHTMSCGKPPDLKAGACYTAYFENNYGEQLVFQYDFESRKGTLWHGDYSWQEPAQVMGGGTTMIMGEEEREWLRLVWRVATRHETREFQLRSGLELINAHKAIYNELVARPQFKGDTWMQRSFAKTIKRLEKEGKAILEELERLKGVDEAERIIEEGGKP
jgi:hypothetical protein